jgi:hypothetical protein
MRTLWKPLSVATCSPSTILRPSLEPNRADGITAPKTVHSSCKYKRLTRRQLLDDTKPVVVGKFMDRMVVVPISPVEAMH